MVRGRRGGEASSSRQSSSSREHPIASTRRRMRIESSSEATILETVEDPVIDPVEEHPNPNQEEATDQPSSSSQPDDISEPLPGGPRDRSI